MSVSDERKGVRKREREEMMKDWIMPILALGISAFLIGAIFGKDWGIGAAVAFFIGLCLFNWTV